MNLVGDTPLPPPMATMHQESISTFLDAGWPNKIPQNVPKTPDFKHTEHHYSAEKFRKGDAHFLVSSEALDPFAVQFCIEDIIHALQNCRRKRNLVSAKGIHTQVCCDGQETHKVLGNFIVPMLVDCGSVSDSQSAFSILINRTEHSWTSLILGYLECGLPQNALTAYQKMQQDCLHPTSYTFVAVLRACGQLKNIERGQEIHAQITMKGLERNTFVASSLVDMYAKCGSLKKAREIFDMLPVRDVVSWNTMIAAYADNELGEQALECFHHLQFDGISPDTVTFVCCLKACSSVRALDKGRQLHNQIRQKSLERELFISNTLMDMYGKCGSLMEAREVFDNLLSRDIVSWNVLIAAYVENGDSENALNCFRKMQQEGVNPNAVTYVSSLKACSTLGRIDEGREMHTELAQMGLGGDLFVGNALIDMYSKFGLPAQAQVIFDKLPNRDVVSWTALLSGYAENGLGQKALKCFEQMQQENVTPNAVTLLCSLKACTRIGALDKGREIHNKIADGYNMDHFGIALIDMYAKCGSVLEAQEVFNKLQFPDMMCWTALIAAYVENGLGGEGLRCYEEMKLKKVSPNNVTFIFCLKACSRLGALDKGQEIHSDIVEKGFQNDCFIGSALIDMYGKCGSVPDAEDVFHRLPVKDAVSWTAMIAAYAENGLAEESLKCFEQMKLDGASPDSVTLLCSLKACGSIGAIDKGRQLHFVVVEKGFEGDLFMGCTLIDMYSKCGSLIEARDVFEKLPIRNIVSWNAMISGYSMNHEVTMAVECFESMQHCTMWPDSTTFICLLTACSRAGLLFKGQEYFKMMKEEYGLVPSADHYTCMVDLYARSGQLYTAERLLETAPGLLSIEAWTALLNACKTYAESELGRRCFQCLISLNSESAASYVLMANIYSSSGRWNE